MRGAVIGLGLIGGSFALALKAKGIATTVVGVEANPQHAAMAIELGIVDSVMPLQEAVAEAELIAIAVPVDVIPQVAIKVLNRVTESQIVIDMGSTKEELCPDGKFDRKSLETEYAELEQQHEVTYAEFQKIRAESQQLWKIKSHIDTARKAMGYSLEHQPKKQEQEI